MAALSIRLPDDLKEKAMRLANKNNISFNALVNYWLQAAVTQDETREWMRKRLQGKNQALLIKKLGSLLDQTKPGREPSLKEIEQAMKGPDA